MALRIRPTTNEMIPEVRAFNARMEAGGSSWKFYDTNIPDWLQSRPGAAAWREYVVAVDDKSAVVRGGFVLKQQMFLLSQSATLIGNVQGPVSEGLVNRKFAPLGALMLKDAMARQPLQIAWGTSKQKAGLLTQAGWASCKFPLLLHVVNQGAFLRGNLIFRSRPKVARAIRVLTMMGLAQLGVSAAQLLLGARSPSLTGVSVVEEAGFGAWANEIWDGAAGQFKLIAVRDAAALSCVMPPDEWPDVIPLRVQRDDRTIGWAAIRDRSGVSDAMFGDLRMGSIVDMLSLPGEERVIAAAAASHLRRRGVDMIGVAASHPRWINAFRSTGFIPLADRRHFAASPALVEAAGGIDELVQNSHLTLMDGDGPRIF